MSRLTRKHRQEILNGYMADSGANQFVPHEFVSWLASRPENPAYAWFEWDDKKAGASFREGQARHFVSGLRVSFSTETVRRGGGIKVSMQTMPAMISPAENRRGGGGYIPLSDDDPAAMNAYCEEAGVALEAWCKRYEAAVAYRGANVNALRKLIDTLLPAEDKAA